MTPQEDLSERQQKSVELNRSLYSYVKVRVRGDSALTECKVCYFLSVSKLQNESKLPHVF